jgi:choline monooxygenase
MAKFTIEKNIAKAETLPASFYRSSEVFEKIKEDIFAKCWHWIGDEHTLLPLAGYAYPFVLLDRYLTEPVFLIRNKENEIKAFSNVCTHRGNIIIHNPGKLNRISCGYHGRSWNMDGRYKSMPEFKEVEDFPRPCDDLYTFQLDRLGPQIFIGLGDIVKFGAVKEVMDQYIGFLPLHEFKETPTLHKDYLVHCHWALYCDNYLEGFHIPFVHDDLNKALDYGSYSTKVFDQVNLQIGYAQGAESTFDLPPGHPDYGKNVAAYYFWIFPNLMLNFYPWGLSINVVKPLTLNSTKVSFRTFVYDEHLLDSGAGALLDKVEREDEFVVEGVHKGLQSRFYKTGRFSATREKGVHHFHGLLASYI